MTFDNKANYRLDKKVKELGILLTQIEELMPKTQETYHALANVSLAMGKFCYAIHEYIEAMNLRMNN